jgi:hypothetical protein
MTVSLTDIGEDAALCTAIVGSISGFETPPVVWPLAMDIDVLAIVVGTPYFASKATQISPLLPVIVSSVSKEILIDDISPGLLGDAVVAFGDGAAANALPGPKRPKTNIVAIAPMTMSDASPKVVPNLVFMYF